MWIISFNTHRNTRRKALPPPSFLKYINRDSERFRLAHAGQAKILIKICLILMPTFSTPTHVVTGIIVKKWTVGYCVSSLPKGKERKMMETELSPEDRLLSIKSRTRSSRNILSERIVMSPSYSGLVNQTPLPLLNSSQTFSDQPGLSLLPEAQWLSRTEHCCFFSPSVPTSGPCPEPQSVTGILDTILAQFLPAAPARSSSF